VKSALLAGLVRLAVWVYQELRFRFYYAPIFHRFLHHKFNYYTVLPWQHKIKFLRMAKRHYEGFEYISRDKLKVTRAMKSIVSSAAAQLTLFLPRQSLNFYHRIVLYTDFYNSSITQRRHKGEVNPGLNTIVFSWRGIEHGLKNKSDGINLLLHEFAHALWLEQKIVTEYDVFEPYLVTAFEQYAYSEMPGLEGNDKHFFRAYAFENMEEFFAVAVENFFERAAEFLHEQPKLYRILAALFKQDPSQFYASSNQQKSIFR
jgi:Mlc titration factor MtfA (ptsG expression regulator)